MAILYIIIGLLLLLVSVFLLFKRNEMKRLEKDIKKEQKKQIQELNQQLDDLLFDLELLNQPLSKFNDLSSKLLNYMK